ncbi:MAG TPA: hypothetical protein VFB78_09015 [Acidimicrobiales bacterium]|nr:hypothetical protein [Acidimicrobiales bacterium]
MRVSRSGFAVALVSAGLLVSICAAPTFAAPQVPKLPNNVSTAATHCYVPEASLSGGGGFLVQDVTGYGYIVCDHYNQALAIAGVLEGEPAGGDIQTSQGDIPMSYADGGFGQNACANAFLCLMTTSTARGYGTRTCWTLTNHGVATSPYRETPSKSGFKCFNF